MTRLLEWGVNQAPGVRVREDLASLPILAAGLGNVAFIGRTARGDGLIQVRTPAEFAAKCGHDLFEALSGTFEDYTPDAVAGYFRHAGNFAGEVWIVSLKGPAKAKASITLPTARPAASGGGDAVTFEGKTAGRWAGRAAALALTGVMGSVGATTIAHSGSPGWAVDQWRGAYVTNTTRSETKLVVGNTATTLNFESDEDLASAGWITGDTVTMNLAHDEHYMAVEVRPGRVDPINEFALDVFVDGSLVYSKDRLTLDPASAYYVTTVLDEDDSNHWITASVDWTDPWDPDVNPVNARGVTTALAATVLTDSAAGFPTSGVEGYSLAGGLLIPDRSNRSTWVRILSNTATAITVSDTVDLTALATHPSNYEIIAPLRCAGGVDDFSGVTIGQYTDALDVADSPLNALVERGVGTLELGVPGFSAFSAANRKAVSDAGEALAAARGWSWFGESTSSLAAGGHTPTTVQTWADVLFGTGATDLAWDSLWGFQPAISWQRVRYAQHKGALIEVPLMGDLMGIRAGQANRTGGYVDPGAGYTPGAGSPFVLKRAVSVDWSDDEDVMAAMERFSRRGLNFLRKIDGRWFVWGARLAQTTDPIYQLEPTRRQVSHYQQTILASRALLAVVFRVQSARARADVRGQLRDYFRGEWEAERVGLPGQSFAEAVTIRLDDELNPAEVQAAGRMIVEVGFFIPGIIEQLELRVGPRGVEVAAAAA